VAHNCGIRHVGGNMVSASIFCWTWRLAHAQFHLNFRNCHSSAYHKYWAPWHICLHGIHLLACKSGHYWSVRGRNILLRGLRAVGGGGGNQVKRRRPTRPAIFWRSIFIDIFIDSWQPTWMFVNPAHISQKWSDRIFYKALLGSKMVRGRSWESLGEICNRANQEYLNFVKWFFSEFLWVC
jgi:hypothetical protein